MKNNYVVFDLDDTLYSEIDFLKSAYNYIATHIDPLNAGNLYSKMLSLYNDKQNVFKFLSEIYPEYNVGILLDLYRNHIPNINLKKGAVDLLNQCVLKGCKLGLLTDGRSITQRNKIRQLSIEHFFDNIIISEEFGSEKPSLKNFETFMKNVDFNYFYVADNTRKDFIGPNMLGWKTICLLDDGYNINKQCFSLPAEFLPQITISGLNELNNLL
jgi:putative hydrolase of the HAD superfamily